MAREEVIRCDVCGKAGASTWTIGNGKTWTIDLCKTHSKPLVELAAQGRETVVDLPKSSSIRAYNRSLRPGSGGPRVDS